MATVTHQAVVAGAVSDFDRAAYERGLASVLSLDASDVSVQYSAGSVIVDATIVTRTEALTDFVMERLTTITASELSEATETDVESVGLPSRSLVMVSSPSPPSPLPPPSLAPPSLPPSPFGDEGGDAITAEGEGGLALDPNVLVLSAIVGAALILVTLFYVWQLKHRRAKARELRHSQKVSDSSPREAPPAPAARRDSGSAAPTQAEVIERKRQAALQRRAAAAAAAAGDGQYRPRAPSPSRQQETAAQVAVEARRTQDMMAVSRHLSKMDRRPASEVPPGILRARSEASSLAESADGGSDSGTGSTPGAPRSRGSSSSRDRTGRPRGTLTATVLSDRDVVYSTV